VKQTPTTQPDPAPPSQAENKTAPKAMLWVSILILAAMAAAVWIFWEPLWAFTWEVWELLQDKEAFRQRIESYGAWAPVVFVVFQIFQVLFSPIPGELVGAAGGYVFGWWGSLLYSTIGLSLGSWINFFLARLLGKGLIERLIPPKYLSKISFLMERQGVIASFIFFVIPGFPKDYLCYVLGLSPMSWRIFLVVSSIGRIPGTLMLSLQGALLYHGRYWSFLVLGAISIAFILPVWFWRDRIYGWLYKLEKDRGHLEPEEDQPPAS
jgi:uncharacterized membrane protein YdjX (TVP38/TMEM64 family)